MLAAVFAATLAHDRQALCTRFAEAGHNRCVPNAERFLVWRTRRTEFEAWRGAATAAGRLKIVLY